MDFLQDLSFNEVVKIPASTCKVVSCDISVDGNLLATGGHEKIARLWSTDTFQVKSLLGAHNLAITDVRFSHSSTRLATSSFDKSIKVWDTANDTNYLPRTFSSHSGSVMSVDFHPINEGLICSSHSNYEIRYWAIDQGTCVETFKGGFAQVRFQPQFGRLLAAVAGSITLVFDVETQACLQSLQGHTKCVQSICWDASGDYLASVSEDSARVWAVHNGSDIKCLYELKSSGNKFYSCAFHPNYASSILIIGCSQALLLWNTTMNKTKTILAHDALVASLAASTATGIVASASHDNSVKLWK